VTTTPAVPAGPAAPEALNARRAEPAISVRGLRKRYGGLVVLDGLDLEVRRGELFALLGPNGAGKTTTVEILEGYRDADAGEVRVLGLDPTRDAAALRPRLGLMLQDGGIAPQVRPRELLRLHAAFYADPADPDALLDLVGLAAAADRRYRLLSGGERQRLSLALALVGRPEILVLDEPTAGMDPAAKVAVRELIGELRATGRTILLTTHELVDVERLADRVGVLDRGRLVALGSPAEVIAGGRPVLRFRTRDPLLPEQVVDLAAVLDATLLDDGAPGGYRVVGRSPDPGLVAALSAWAAGRGLLLDEIRTTGGTLEERFLQLVSAAEDER
jgi:ABC-2 type transport system ATP-binding protein